MKIDGPLHGSLNRQIAVTMVMWSLVIAAAISVVYSKHVSRILHAKVQTVHKERVALQNETGMLLLEKATWTADARLEQIARSQLDMTMPSRVEMIKP